MTRTLAGIELGGTKCVCAFSTSVDDIEIAATIPTTTPAETFSRISHVLASRSFDSLGIGSFGPLCLDIGSSGHGVLGATPKPGWSQADLKTLVPGETPFAIHTDVVAAGLAEGKWGAARACENWVYITVGTGVGTAVFVDRQPIGGKGHPEAGHMRIPEFGDSAGNCPYHRSCVEGQASGPAIAARAGRPASQVSPADPVWRDTARALAALVHNLLLSCLPDKIIFGGSVMLRQPQLIGLIGEELEASLAGYVPLPGDDFLTLATLGNHAGVAGAMLLAQSALGQPHEPSAPLSSRPAAGCVQSDSRHPRTRQAQGQ